MVATLPKNGLIIKKLLASNVPIRLVIFSDLYCFYKVFLIVYIAKIGLSIAKF